MDSFLQSLNRENDTNYAVSPVDMERLLAYDWPGNVRELRHSIQRAYILTSADDRYLSLPEQFSSPFSRRQADNSSSVQVGRTIDEVERELITRTLEKFANNKTRAAEVLGVSVKTLYNRLSNYEVKQDE